MKLLPFLEWLEGNKWKLIDTKTIERRNPITCISILYWYRGYGKLIIIEAYQDESFNVFSDCGYSTEMCKDKLIAIMKK